MCSAIIFIHYPLSSFIATSIHRHSATQWVRGRGRTENPRTETKAQFVPSLAKFHFGQLIVFLWCVGFNCLSLNIRLNWWVLVWGEPFALFWVKNLNIVNSLFSIENHAVSVIQKMWVLTAQFAHASPWFMSWPHNSLSCPPGHKAWLFCNLILVGIPAVLPCSWAAECGSMPAHLPELLWSDYAFSAFLTLAAYEIQRSLKSAYLSFIALNRDRVETISVHGILVSCVSAFKGVRKSLHTEYLTIFKKC